MKTQMFLVIITFLIRRPSVITATPCERNVATMLVQDEGLFICLNAVKAVIVRKPDTICRAGVHAKEVLQPETACRIAVPTGTHIQTAGVR